MENLTCVIVAIGALVGGPIMMFGYRKTDQKPVAFRQIHGALKKDWMWTGNIDFHAAVLADLEPCLFKFMLWAAVVTEPSYGERSSNLRPSG